VLKGLTYPELEAWCVERGEKPSRAAQLFTWLYGRGRASGPITGFADTFDEQNGFSRAFVAMADTHATLDTGLTLASCQTAADGTRKLLFAVEGTTAQVECVLIPVVREQVRSQSTPHSTSVPACC